MTTTLFLLGISEEKKCFFFQIKFPPDVSLDSCHEGYHWGLHRRETGCVSLPLPRRTEAGGWNEAGADEVWFIREHQRGKYLFTVDLMFDWFGISCLTTDNFCFCLQNRLIQTGQTGGQLYSDTSPFSVPWIHWKLLCWWWG